MEHKGLSPELNEALTKYEKDLVEKPMQIGNDIDREALPASECWVVAMTTIQAMVLANSQGESEDAIIPPLREFRLHVSGFNPPDVFLFALRAARRIRNYAAFTTSLRLPLAYRMIAKDLLWPQSFGTDFFLYPPELSFRQIAKEDWVASMTKLFDKSSELLASIPNDSFLDRAIGHLGEAIWTDDIEDSFLRCWRSLETIADWDFLTAKAAFEKSLENTLRPYLEESDLGKVTPRSDKIGKLQRVLVMVRSHSPKTSPELVKEFWDLRNAIAHGEVTHDKYKEILVKRASIFSLAHGIIDSLTVGLGSKTKDE
jgi:hypothetical protein